MGKEIDSYKISKKETKTDLKCSPQTPTSRSKDFKLAQITAKITLKNCKKTHPNS
jgi:hypothetical protein